MRWPRKVTAEVTMRILLASVFALAVLCGFTGTAPAQQMQRAAAGNAPVKVVYHLTAGLDEAQHAMANIRNHLRADPSAKIVVIGNGKGIDFMLDGAKDQNGYPFDATIQQLKAQGVDFRLCANSLTARKLDRTKVVPDVTIIESGVAEVARLQAKEGFVYLHP
jgi:intracellular sulfur oxidation DsrE/DsrF family protein